MVLNWFLSQRIDTLSRPIPPEQAVEKLIYAG